MLYRIRFQPSGALLLIPARRSGKPCGAPIRTHVAHLRAAAREPYLDLSWRILDVLRRAYKEQAVSGFNETWTAALHGFDVIRLQRLASCGVAFFGAPPDLTPSTQDGRVEDVAPRRAPPRSPDERPPRAGV